MMSRLGITVLKTSSENLLALSTSDVMCHFLFLVLVFAVILVIIVIHEDSY